MLMDEECDTNANTVIRRKIHRAPNPETVKPGDPCLGRVNLFAPEVCREDARPFLPFDGHLVTHKL